MSNEPISTIDHHSNKPWTIARLENGQRVISQWRFELRTDAEKLKAAIEKNKPGEQWQVIRVRRKPG